MPPDVLGVRAGRGERVPVAIGSGAVREEIVHVLDAARAARPVRRAGLHRRRRARQARSRDLPALPGGAAPGATSRPAAPRTAWCWKTRGSASPPRMPPACAASPSTPRASWSGLRRPIWSCKVSRRARLGTVRDGGCMTIDEVIAGVPAWAGRDVQAESIEGGLTNANYRLTVGDEQFCVRIPGQRLVAARGRPPGRAPEHAGGGRGGRRRARAVHGGRRAVMVLEWITGEVQTEETLHRDGAVEQIAASVRAPARRAAVRRRVRHVASSRGTATICAEHGFRIPDDYDDHADVVRRIEQAMAVRAPTWCRATTTCWPRTSSTTPERLPDHRLRVHRHERSVLRARQHRRASRSSGASGSSALIELVLRRAAAQPRGARAPVGGDGELRLDAVGVHPARGLDHRLRLLGVGRRRQVRAAPSRRSPAPSSSAGSTTCSAATDVGSIAVVVEPAADDARHECRLRLEPERACRAPRRRRSAARCAGRAPRRQPRDHRRCDPLPPVADAVQTSIRYALQTPSESRRAIPTTRSPSWAIATCWDCSNDGAAPRASAVVEVVGPQVGLRPRPVDAVERFADGHGHGGSVSHDGYPSRPQMPSVPRSQAAAGGAAVAARRVAGGASLPLPAGWWLPALPAGAAMWRPAPCGSAGRRAARASWGAVVSLVWPARRSPRRDGSGAPVPGGAPGRRARRPP